MTKGRIHIREVLVYLGVDQQGLLDRLRDEGLFEAEEIAPEEAEDLRLATILMEELGVNAPGVDVALHLRRRLLALEQRALALAEALADARGEP